MPCKADNVINHSHFPVINWLSNYPPPHFKVQRFTWDSICCDVVVWGHGILGKSSISENCSLWGDFTSGSDFRRLKTHTHPFHKVQWAQQNERNPQGALEPLGRGEKLLSPQNWTQLMTSPELINITLHYWISAIMFDVWIMQEVIVYTSWTYYHIH